MRGIAAQLGGACEWKPGLVPPCPSTMSPVPPWGPFAGYDTELWRLATARMGLVEGHHYIFRCAGAGLGPAGGQEDGWGGRALRRHAQVGGSGALAGAAERWQGQRRMRIATLPAHRPRAWWPAAGVCRC